MYEIIMTLGIIGFIFVWFYYGYKGAERIKDENKYQFGLVLEERAWKKGDVYFYHFCILTGLISYFNVVFLYRPDPYTIYCDKRFLMSMSEGYKDIEGFEDQAQSYIERIEKFEKEIEGPYYLKYKIDPCDLCIKEENCCLEHYDFRLCSEFCHIKALD